MQKKRIAVTGGIGSGKSTVLNIIKELGYKTLSSDKIVWDLYAKRKVKKLIKAHFPSAVSGRLFLTLDRAELSKQAFSSEHKHAQLTALITPLVLEQINKITKDYEGLTFVEVPLLFECSYEKYFDGVWVVTRPINERITAVKNRSNLTEEQIIARIKKQVDYDKMDLSPYIVVENNQDLATLKERISRLIAP